MSDVVNVRVKVTNLLDQTTTGLIHSFNPSQSVLALKVEPSRIRIINTAFIKAVQVVQPHKKHYYRNSYPRLSKVDLQKLEADLNEAMAKYTPFEEHDKSSQKPSQKQQQQQHQHPQQHQQHQSQQQDKHHPQNSHHHSTSRQNSKRRDSSSHASSNAQTIFNSLSTKFGKENVQWLPNDSINVFKDVVIAKPYTLNKMGGKRSPKAEEVRNALRSILLDVGPGNRGG
ncbi:hypothetical protein CJI97_001055 [Candidozyma auris]|uniref:AD domain-containing protein n=1 Tax=Candidozyma auris TaxID=498019 RepID=A0A2H1A518_CANAR|nr:hypothetical_protein [[Candida] auris]PIS57999.1 hypothetical protein CJI97_001055 [[Candida] auris]PIS58535.1 hypothetical protein B9J08_001035 [[Candida] auris]PSK75988.1 hypothetical protein CJJ07_004189 [[Candida] auris]QEL60881.1 hypothetical protein CJJ09_003001 [[Candida] auris]QEO20607.1 hypothetical_protein [[Candida] auris]